MVYRYFEIIGDIEVLPNGMLYWVAGFWLDKATRDQGAAPTLTNDFSSNANMLIGARGRELSTRLRAGVTEVELLDGSWMALEQWRNGYPITDRGGNVLETRPAAVTTPTEPVPATWVRDDIIAWMRTWARTHSTMTGDHTLPELRTGERHPTATVPDEVRAITALNEDTLPEYTERQVTR
jgi:hypothetical protein